MIQLYDIKEPGEGDDNLLSGHVIYNVIGIDFGTTNSVVAFVNDGNLQLVEDKNQHLIPSVIKYTPNGIVEAVGIDALKTEGYIASIKRMVGKTKTIANKSVLEIVADILSSLKKKAETYLDLSIKYAVITVPAYFNWLERRVIKQAANIAGIEVLRLINEPTAAAFAYGLNKKSKGIYLVYDLGGGTFDVSILRLERGLFEVLATGGDRNLGGDDIDMAIYNDIIATTNCDIKYNQEQIRQIKHLLSDDSEWQGEINGYNILYRDTQLQKIMDVFILRTQKIISKVLKEAEINDSQIDEIMFVGGSTKNHYIRDSIVKYLGKESALSDIDPDRIVAIGAAYQADELTSCNDNKNLLLDITPLSLGIEIADGNVDIIISKNTTLPYEYKKQFTTYKDGQSGFIINVLQGEEKKAVNCTRLTSIELKNIPLRPAGSVKIQICFRVDVDGILTVSANDIANENLGVEVIVKPFIDEESHGTQI